MAGRVDAPITPAQAAARMAAFTAARGDQAEEIRAAKFIELGGAAGGQAATDGADAAYAAAGGLEAETAGLAAAADVQVSADEAEAMQGFDNAEDHEGSDDDSNPDFEAPLDAAEGFADTPADIETHMGPEKMVPVDQDLAVVFGSDEYDALSAKLGKHLRASVAVAEARPVGYVTPALQKRMETDTAVLTTYRPVDERSDEAKRIGEGLDALVATKRIAMARPALVATESGVPLPPAQRDKVSVATAATLAAATPELFPKVPTVSAETPAYVPKGADAPPPIISAERAATATRRGAKRNMDD